MKGRFEPCRQRREARTTLPIPSPKNRSAKPESARCVAPNRRCSEGQPTDRSSAILYRRSCHIGRVCEKKRSVPAPWPDHEQPLRIARVIELKYGRMPESDRPQKPAGREG